MGYGWPKMCTNKGLWGTGACGNSSYEFIY